MTYLLIWSIAPAQNFPKNFLAPRALRSWITKGHRWSTLFREIRSRFSTITTFAPNNCASIAVRRPHGPAPIIRTYSQQNYDSRVHTINTFVYLMAVCCYLPSMYQNTRKNMSTINLNISAHTHTISTRNQKWENKLRYYLKNTFQQHCIPHWHIVPFTAGHLSTLSH